MNLHAIVSGAINSVNPSITATFKASTGYGTNSAGKRTPTYAAPVSVTAQVQELSSRDLRQLEGLNVQGSSSAIYLNGFASGAVRVSRTGGDIITIPSGPSAGTYLVTAVLEQWPDWVKVSATLQNGS